MPFHFNAGLREENTHLTSAGFGQVPVDIIQNAGDPTLLTVVLSDPQSVSTKSNYSYLLPSVDMKLELTDKLHLRFDARSEEHTSELQSLMRISYAVFCLKKKNIISYNILMKPKNYELA